MNWIRLKYLEFKNNEKNNNTCLKSLEKSNKYKVEIKISEKYEIFVYIDLVKIYYDDLINSDKILYRLLNTLKYSLKFNEYYFNKYYKSLYDKKPVNFSKDILVNCQSNNIITLNDVNIDLYQKNIISKKNYLIILNTYILYNIPNNDKLIKNIKHNDHTLFISKKTYKSIKSIKLVDLKKNYDLYIKKKYSILVIEDYLEQLDKNDYNILKLFNIKIIFLENRFIKFTYDLYIKLNNLCFNLNYNNDLSLNVNFIKKNIINFGTINKSITVKIINNDNKKLKFFNVDNNLIYEEILDKLNIDYKLSIDNNIKKKRCHLTNEYFENDICIKLSCKHEIKFGIFKENIKYSHLCPICNSNIKNTNLIYRTSETCLKNILISELINNNLSKSLLNIVIFEIYNKYNGKYLNKRIKKINEICTEKILVKFFSHIEFINDYKLKEKNLSIYVLYNKLIHKYNKYEIINKINNLKLSKISELNLIKYN